MMDLGLPTLASLPQLGVCFLGGVLLGYGYFRTLRMTVDVLIGGGAPLLGAALTLGRVAVLCVGLYLAVQAGGMALLAALAGLLATKTFVMARTRAEKSAPIQKINITPQLIDKKTQKFGTPL